MFDDTWARPTWHVSRHYKAARLIRRVLSGVSSGPQSSLSVAGFARHIHTPPLDAHMLGKILKTTQSVLLRYSI